MIENSPTFVDLLIERGDKWRDAARTAEANLSRVKALFSGGPDTPCRTVWDGDIECVSVPLADLNAALDGTR